MEINWKYVLNTSNLNVHFVFIFYYVFVYDSKSLHVKELFFPDSNTVLENLQKVPYTSQVAKGIQNVFTNVLPGYSSTLPKHELNRATT
jgi:hypothetical protein